MKLNNIIEFYKGLSIPRDRTSVDNDIPYLHYGDIYKLYNNRIDINKNLLDIIKINKSEKILHSQLLKDGDIVMNLTSENYKDLGKSILIINEQNIPFVSGMETYRLIIKNKNIMPEYLQYFFQSTNYKNQLSQLVTGMKVYRAHPKHFNNIDVPLIAIAEQQHIVDTIGSIDDLIEMYNKLSAKQDDLERMYFLKENSNNMKTPLRDHVYFIKGKKPVQFTNKGTNYLTINVLESEALLYANTKNTIRCKHNDVLMVMDGASSGKVYIGNSGIVGSTLSKLVCKEINPYFCYIFLKNNFEYINGNTTGSAIPHTNKDLVLELNVPTQQIPKLAYDILFGFRVSINKRVRKLNQIKKLYLKKFFG